MSNSRGPGESWVELKKSEDAITIQGGCIYQEDARGLFALRRGTITCQFSGFSTCLVSAIGGSAAAAISAKAIGDSKIV